MELRFAWVGRPRYRRQLWEAMGRQPKHHLLLEWDLSYLIWVVYARQDRSLGARPFTASDDECFVRQNVGDEKTGSQQTSSKAKEELIDQKFRSMQESNLL